jgi:hypothetical protein
MATLKWGLARRGNKLYNTIKDAIEILKQRHAQTRDFNPKEVLGAAVFKAYSDTEIENRPALILNNQEINAYLANIQIGVGKKLKGKNRVLRSKINEGKTRIIERDIGLVVEEATQIPDLSHASSVLLCMYELRERSGDKFFEYMGNVVNAMSDPNNYIRKYAEQAQLLERLLRKK